ncbi:alpha/beta hydrolase [Fodinicola acaciae]|uniref:alpha/beta hydrolase n=1 Tax=Fodinicola acaciae TaxID=2681555 RepID=UPI0013D54CEB|nr:alpha/beta hydrolase [Fodinicola acaciae]
MTYAFDPELAPWVEMLPKIDLTGVDIPAMRAAQPPDFAELFQNGAYEPANPLDVRDLTIPGPADNPDLRVRIYSPANEETARPGLVYIHGGGFVFGSIEQMDPATTQIADQLGIVVVSVEYRLAPENRFPAGVEDCYAALQWTAAKASELRIDPDRIGVAGSSAGGGLAAAVALLARDRGGPPLKIQVLDVPELDDRLETPSMHAYHDTPLWNRPNAIVSWRSYLPEGVTPGSDGVSPYAAPSRATDLSGLPRAYVSVCEFDPLRDEGIDYAQRLVQAGVATELHLYPGTFHGSALIAAAAVTKRMNADNLAFIQRHL